MMYENIIHQFFWNLYFFKHFDQKHDFSMLVSHKNFIVQYFKDWNMCQMKEGKIFEMGIIYFFHFFPSY
jgi:ABC-type oligopeptide transport system ATPase subunit